MKRSKIKIFILFMLCSAMIAWTKVAVLTGKEIYIILVVLATIATLFQIYNIEKDD